MPIDPTNSEIQRLRAALQEIADKGAKEGVEDGQIVEWDATFCAACATRVLASN